MLLIAIVAATLLAGVGSVWIAAALSFGVLANYTQHMLSLAAGALLATAFISLVPEAFASGVAVKTLSATILLGLMLFFLLDKAELWHHSHERHAELPTLEQAMVPTEDAEGAQPRHEHGHTHHHHHAHVSGGWAVLAGDVVHCLGDGVLIASAFLADMRVGWAVALAVLVHEVPHHMGDLAVLGAGGNRRSAVWRVSLAGATTVVGGVMGLALVLGLGGLPYFLALAASSFIYVALADLIPQLQRQLSGRQTMLQVAWLALGMILVMVALGAADALGHA